jgi:hypothetical protein
LPNLRFSVVKIPRLPILSFLFYTSQNSGLTKAAKRNFSVGVFIDATPAMGGNGGPRPGMGMGMRGMGMGMRGMGGGRRYGGGGGQGQKEDANWYTFRLASK